ncbi:hypothetical protein QTP88_005857 [Uroleucon formosanum]
MNETKSIHGTFALRQGVCLTLYLNNQPLPPVQCIRYLGILIDRRLTWKPHIISKTRTLNDRFRLLRSLLTSKHMKLSNKLLLYKLLLKPIWTYGIQLWGAAKISNINRIQRFQSKTLRTILKAPFYVSNHTLHTDLKIPFVSDLAKTHYKRFNSRLVHHKNPLISDLSSASIPGTPFGGGTGCTLALLFFPCLIVLGEDLECADGPPEPNFFHKFVFFQSLA